MNRGRILSYQRFRWLTQPTGLWISPCADASFALDSRSNLLGFVVKPSRLGGIDENRYLPAANFQ